MKGLQAERAVVWTMRLLACAFAVTGILFIATPDGVLGALDDLGAELGDFTPAPESDQRLWLGLGFAYMVVITGLALIVQSDVARFRPLLLLLAAGKAASSVTAGAFFFLDADVFPYLLNLLVDGGLVIVALGCWVLAGRVGASGQGARGGGADLAGGKPASAAQRPDPPARAPVPPD